MKIPITIADDYKGNPRIKLTQDAPEVTFTVYTEDMNLLKSLVGKMITIDTTEYKE